MIVICEYKDVQYFDLSFRLPTISVEFLTVLVRFHTSAYSVSVSEPAFSKPDPVSSKKNIETEVEMRFFRPFPSLKVANIKE